MPPPSRNDGGLPTREPTGTATTTTATNQIISRPDFLTALDATAERLRGHLVLQVVVDDDGHQRTTVYRSAAPAERAIKRARARGRTAHLTLVQLVPIGVVVGLDGGLR